MRVLVLAVLALVAAGAARADDVWPDPTGAFTLAINSRVWETIPADSPGVMLQLKPRYGVGFSCDVQQQPLSAGSENLPQADLNAMMNSTTQAQMQAALETETITRFEVAPKDGVTIVSMRSQGEHGANSIVRVSHIFVAKGAGPAATSRISCVSRANGAASGHALMDKWFASLTFTPTR